MKKRIKAYGFTLIELLAVIAILALLIILVVPNIIKIYAGAKKQIFLTEAKTVYREAEKKIISESLKGNDITNITSENNTKLKMTGKKLKYCINVNDGKVKSITVSDGNYYINITNIYQINELILEEVQIGGYEDLPCYTNGVEIGEDYTFENPDDYEFIVPTSGIYKLEVWGAQGGATTGGKGGYSKGEIKLEKGDKLYIYIGGSGTSGGTSGGFNGGGGGSSSTGGGGATDMRIGGNTLNHRFIVAGGGGAGYSNYAGGAGGGTSAQNGSGNKSYRVGAAQTTGNSFGIGASSPYGGGGGGWYGGYAGYYGDDGIVGVYLSGSGGSGYVWTSSTASNVPSGYAVDTKYYLFNYEIKRGTETIPNPAGGTMTGKSGNGYAKISYVGKDTRENDFLSSVKSKTPYEIDEPGIYKLKLPAAGRYKLEVWGAQGGTTTGGKGGYSKGEIILEEGTELYIYVGASGLAGEVLGGFNGGGSGGTGGGGATDIRIGGNTLNHRLIVAGGGGSGYSGFAGGAGGGTSGQNGAGNKSSTNGATQTTGYSFGKAGGSSYCGGGGGWYGGYAGHYGDDGIVGIYVSGSGGSGFVWTSSTASNAPSSYLVDAKYYLSNIQTVLGNVTNGMPNPDGGTMTGKSGEGYARITYLGVDIREEEFLAAMESKTPYGLVEPGIYEIEIPKTGKYKLEVWGAQGGYKSENAKGGNGGYSKGEATLEEGEKLYIYVGASGNTGEILGGFNGGGAGGISGGGATDMRIGGNSLNHRFIVAGGGGSGFSSYAGGVGGGTSGQSGTGNKATNKGGTQTTGFSFGIGESSSYSGAGGGWYGGQAGRYYDDGIVGIYLSGSGGSGYVWTSSTASNVPDGYKVNTKYYLSNAITVAGNETDEMPNPTGGTMTGKSGNGYARITYLGL